MTKYYQNICKNHHMSLHSVQLCSTRQLLLVLSESDSNIPPLHAQLSTFYYTRTVAHTRILFRKRRPSARTLFPITPPLIAYLQLTTRFQPTNEAITDAQTPIGTIHVFEISVDRGAPKTYILLLGPAMRSGLQREVLHLYRRRVIVPLPPFLNGSPCVHACVSFGLVFFCFILFLNNVTQGPSRRAHEAYPYTA